MQVIFIKKNVYQYIERNIFAYKEKIADKSRYYLN